MQHKRSPAAFGPYVHRKGGLYFALGTVRDSEGSGARVVYVGSSGAWDRPAAMFHDGRFTRPWKGLAARLGRVALRAVSAAAVACERRSQRKPGAAPQ